MNDKKFMEFDNWREALDELVDFLSQMCAPPSTAPAWEWCELHIVVKDGPFKGRWRAQLTPMAKWVLQACQHPRVRRVVLMVSAQSAKTLLMLMFFNWCVKEDPADSMWVMADADHMGEFVEKRLLPSIEGCDATAPLLVDAKKGMLKLKNMNLMLRGSNSRAKLQSDPIKRLFCDERREWKPGAIDLVRKRTRTFHNSMELSAGTAGAAGDELHRDYQEGSQTVPHFSCLKCEHSQPFRFAREHNCFWVDDRERGGLVWDMNETTRPNGIWDYDAVKKTVRLECEKCGHRYANSEKYDLIRTMHPSDYNPKMPSVWSNPENPGEIQSFHWSALEMIWETCDWGNIVVEFLKACEVAKTPPYDVEPLKAFVTETLGEPWEDRLGVIKDYGFLETRKREYAYGDPWGEMQRAFISADAQEAGGEHYYWVARMFGFGAESRLIAHGKANTLEELEEARKYWKIPTNNAMIDTGYKTQELYRFALAHGWKCFKGDSDTFYLKRRDLGNNNYETYRSIWRKTRVAVYEPESKRRIAMIPLFTFCDDPTKDMLADYMKGTIGNWTFPTQIDKNYLEQMSAERREEIISKATGRVQYIWKRWSRANHYLDCEKMILIAALITRTISARRIKPIPPN
ncbi:MAG TPA: terminase gpA endonuclease subunit [Verrucomicrobiae bacterium]|jgi:phage terminase large subunit GpA-like protein